MAENAIRIEGTTPVSGTVTTVPSGTQNVSVTSPVTFPVSGTVGLSGQPLSVYQAQNPAYTGVYIFSRAEQPGVVAANNHMTLFNPVGSGKSIFINGVFISSIIVGDIAATATSMRGYRLASAPSGGTLEPTASYCKNDSTYPNPVAEIRTGTVTATPDDGIFNSPPLIGSVKGSSPFVHQIPFPLPFRLAAGEGIALRTEAGDVDTRWNLSILWSEA